MKHLIFLLAVISITACTTTPEHPFVADADLQWQQRQPQLTTINDWHLNGRVAIISDQESWHLSMKWQRHADKYILDLSGPFGVGHAQLTGTSEGVILVDSDKQVFYADSPERLLQEVTGLSMPVKSLLFWMRGLPNSNLEKENLKIDEYGRLALLKQDNWRVRFKRYTNSEKFELPQKIFIDRNGLKVKIFVDEWDLTAKEFISVKDDE